MKNKQFKEWCFDQIKSMAPYAKTIVPKEHYFATCGNDDVCVIFSRKIKGYDSWHFTTDSLAKFYGAKRVAFDCGYGIELTSIPDEV